MIIEPSYLKLTLSSFDPTLGGLTLWLSFGMGMHTRCLPHYCILKVCNLLFLQAYNCKEIALSVL